MSTVALKANTNTKTEGKKTLTDRFKAYVMENLPTICGGLLAISGQTNGYYCYKMLSK